MTRERSEESRQESRVRLQTAQTQRRGQRGRSQLCHTHFLLCTEASAGASNVATHFKFRIEAIYFTFLPKRSKPQKYPQTGKHLSRFRTLNRIHWDPLVGFIKLGLEVFASTLVVGFCNLKKQHHSYQRSY